MAPQGVCIAFGDATLAPNPSWTRIDDPNNIGVVQGWNVDRGRNKELDKNQTGTATIDVIDKTGVLDPTNPGSPFVDNINPMKQAAIALRNPVTNAWSTIYRGFSDWEFEISSDTGFKAIKTTIECEDAFDLMSALEMTPGNHYGKKTTGTGINKLLAQYEGDIQFAEDQQPHDRINQALDDAGWPSSLREVFSGNIKLQMTTYARRDQLLTVILDTADAEFPGVANVFISKEGNFVFHGRYARFDPFNPQYHISQWYAGDFAACEADSDYAPIHRLGFRRSKQDIINVGLALPKGVTDYDAPKNIIIDTASVGTYGWRTAVFEDLVVKNGIIPSAPDLTAVQETKLYGQYYVDNMADPQTRITQLTFKSKRADHPNAGALWALMCGVEIGDVVTVKTTHPGGGGFNNVDFFVEGVHYSAGPLKANMHDITLTLDVSPRAFYVISPFYN